MANGKIIYPSGADPGDQTTYTFPLNFDFGHTLGYVETDDNVRTLDGTLNSYAGALKKTFELTFTRATRTQFDYFMTVWSFHCPVDLYLDGSNLDAVVKIMSPPSGNSEAAFDSTGRETYTFTVTMEEI